MNRPFSLKKSFLYFVLFVILLIFILPSEIRTNQFRSSNNPQIAELSQKLNEDLTVIGLPLNTIKISRDERISKNLLRITETYISDLTEIEIIDYYTRSMELQKWKFLSKTPVSLSRQIFAYRSKQGVVISFRKVDTQNKQPYGIGITYEIYPISRCIAFCPTPEME